MLLVKFSALTWATPIESVLELMRLKMVPWLCSCFRTILCFPCHCFLTIFLPMSSWKHDFLYSCCLTCSALYPNITLDEERMAKSLQESSITKILHFSFYCGLGLSSINMVFISVMRNCKSLKDFFYSLVSEGCCMYHGQRERACTTLY